MDIQAIRKELQDGTDPDVSRRRRIAALAGGLAAEFAVIGMHQYGVIRRLPDLPVRGFDSNAVIGSRAAYPFGVPDAAIAVTGLGAMIALATAGGSERTGRSPWFDVALGVSALVGAATAAYYVKQMIDERKACAYCLTSTAGFAAIVPMALRVAFRAVRKLAR